MTWRSSDGRSEKPRVVKNVAHAVSQEASSTAHLQSTMKSNNVRRNQESGVFIEISQFKKYWLLIQPENSEWAKPRMSVDCIQLMSLRFMRSDIQHLGCINFAFSQWDECMCLCTCVYTGISLHTLDLATYPRMRQTDKLEQ